MALSETALATAAVLVVRSIMSNMANGASEEVGAKLINFLQSRLQIILKPQQVKREHKQLEGVILNKARTDAEFKNELEQLVNEFQRSLNSEANYEQSDVSINQQNISGPAIGINNNVGPQFFR